jgi:squalene-hopene/tetraprenyl-beta-curcumene cyclase
VNAPIDVLIEQPKLDALDQLIETATRQLTDRQQADGHIVFDLEADATISAEYILLNHFLDEREPELEAKLADYIRSIQEPHGGWGLFFGGDLDLSCSVKAYWALKVAGDAALSCRLS